MKQPADFGWFRWFLRFGQLSKAALMPVYDARNVLHIGPPQREGDAEIAPAMADAVRQRIQGAGGNLVVGRAARRCLRNAVWRWLLPACPPWR
jgi:hypothetical protein